MTLSIICHYTLYIISLSNIAAYCNYYYTILNIDYKCVYFFFRKKRFIRKIQNTNYHRILFKIQLKLQKRSQCFFKLNTKKYDGRCEG